MSVLIKGMEMPTGNHEIIIRIQSDGRVLDQYGHRFNLEPFAVPIPPHGRLIDADAFISQKREQICKNCDRRRGMKDGKLTKRFVYTIGDAPCRACGIGDMLDYVDDAPAILPAEEAVAKDTNVPSKPYDLLYEEGGAE